MASTLMEKIEFYRINDAISRALGADHHKLLLPVSFFSVTDRTENTRNEV